MKFFWHCISFYTEMTDTPINHGTLYYDGECRICTSLAERGRRLLERRGFRLAPLQDAGAKELQHLENAELLSEMRLLTPGGKTLGGADALIHIARFVWWAMPVRLIAWLPGGKALLRRGYRWIAARRNCAAGTCAMREAPGWTGWAPLLILPGIAALAAGHLPPWLFMWGLAGAIFLGCKWLAWRDAVAPMPGTPLPRSIGFLLFWPGMDARAFLDVQRAVKMPAVSEWVFAAVKTLLGGILLWGVARRVFGVHPLLAGWIGMVGFIFLLHFGVFHLLALVWQSAGIAAEPIMRMPLVARTLGEFWSVRWNRGFNDLAHRHLFQPIARRWGITAAMLLTFLASGLVHDLVISVPARGGYGLPTIYFLLQGAGIVMERRFRRGLRGRWFTLLVAGGPAWWLFHPAFVGRVFIPFMEVIKAL